MLLRTKRVSPSARALVASMVLVGLGWPSSASARDADANRMQAQRLELDEPVADSLDPPEDAADWRYFKLVEARVVTVQVTGASADASLRVTLTSATGDSLKESEVPGSGAPIEASLDPGIYYVKVTAQAPTAYQVTLR